MITAGAAADDCRYQCIFRIILQQKRYLLIRAKIVITHHTVTPDRNSSINWSGTLLISAELTVPA
jgi:hypothetical protein